MNYLTYADLTRDSVALARRLPRNTVGVLGVPRSGMLPAAVIAQELGCHLGDVQSFVDRGGAFMRPGRRMAWGQDPDGPLVVVDDSLYRGASIDAARSVIASNPWIAEREILYAAVYVAPGEEWRVGFTGRTVELPRLFEWNWTAHDLLEEAMCDLDGIICEDPSAYDDGGPAYEDALCTAKPLYRVRRPIGTIVTGRLEKWRTLTEEYLAWCGATPKALVMAPFETPDERRAYGVAKWKGEVYAASDYQLFIESDWLQCATIGEMTCKAVLCPPRGRVWRAPS